MKMTPLTLLILFVILHVGLNDQRTAQMVEDIYKRLVNDPEFNLDHLYREYLKVLPYNFSCPTYTPGTPNVDGEVFFIASRQLDEKIGFYNTGWVEECSCKPGCVAYKTCCPNIIYGYLNYTCVNTSLVKSNIITEGIAFDMIATCPTYTSLFNFSSDNASNLAPVTSLFTGLTYKNVHYAHCNAEFEELVSWNITVYCDNDTSEWINDELLSLEQLVSLTSRGICEIRYVVTLPDNLHPARCDRSALDGIKVSKHIVKNDIITSCNSSGLWENYDRGVEYACKTYTNIFRYYKSVYCYICNPGLAFKYFKRKPIVSICNDSDVYSTNDISDACAVSERTNYFLPYKNVYCQLCKTNGNEIYLVIMDWNYTSFLYFKDISKETIFNLQRQLKNLTSDPEPDIEDTDIEEGIGGRRKIKIEEIHYFYGWNYDGDTIVFDWNMTYGDENYKCLMPSYNAEFAQVCDSLLQEGLKYQCLGNYTANNDDYNRIAELTSSGLYDTFYQYLFDLFFCHPSVKENQMCQTSTAANTCPLQVDVSGKNKYLSCLFCGMYSLYNTYPEEKGPDVNLLLKVTCPFPQDKNTFPNLTSFLHASLQECQLTFVPTGILDMDFNLIYGGAQSCIDLPFIDQFSCKDTDRDYLFGSYRKLFSISRRNLADDMDVNQYTENAQRDCVDIDQLDFDNAHESPRCRNILCSRFHLLGNGTCDPSYEEHVYIRYRLPLYFRLIITKNESFHENAGLQCMKSASTFRKMCRNIWESTLEQVDDDKNHSLISCQVHAVESVKEEHNSVSVETGVDLKVTVEIAVNVNSELSLIENTLVDSFYAEYVSDTINNCNYYRLKERNAPFEVGHELIFNQVYFNLSQVDVLLSAPILVKRLLNCLQIELFDDEYELCEKNDCIILVGSKKQIGPDSYEMKDGKIHVCLDAISYKTSKGTGVSMLQYIYKTVDNACTILSLLCLSLTFITYCLFPSLRNIPAYNTMNLIVSLFCAQLTLKLGIWQPTRSFLCYFVGMCIHFFWIATFCSMNICSFHMYRVFCSVPKRNYSTKVIIYYLIYTYLTPCVITLLTAITHLGLSNGSVFGYGNRICFLDDIITSIVAFLVPCVLIFFVNTVFFVKTFLSIRKTLKTSKGCSEIDRNEFLIYIKLWTLLGIAWPLLIVDAIFDISIFSFIALAFNTLQGVFIFISYVCNKRVINMYCSLLACCKTSEA